MHINETPPRPSPTPWGVSSLYKPTSLSAFILVSDVEAFTSCNSYCEFRLLRVAEYRILSLYNEVLFAFWSEFANISASSCRKIKFIQNCPGSGCQQSSTVIVRHDTWQPQVLRLSGVPLSTPQLAINVDRHHYRSLTSCVVRWQASSSSVSTVRRRCRLLPWPTVVIVNHCRGENWFCWCRLPGFRLVFRSFFFYHGPP